MEFLTEDDSTEILIKQRHQRMNRMIFCLYQSEIYAQSVSAGRIEELPHYRKALAEVLVTADSLRPLLTDSIQCARLDTLSTLLLSKERKLYDVLSGVKKLSTFHEHSIEQLRRHQDSIFQVKHVQRDTVVHHNTYKVPSKKRGLFKRIAEVFAPSKTDSTMVVNVTSELRSDTLLQPYNPADTLVSMLDSIQEQLDERRLQAQQILHKKTEYLLLDGLAISNRVNSVLQALENEEQNFIQHRQTEIKAIRNQSVMTLAFIATAAILFSCILLVLIGRDISRSNHYRVALERAKEKAEHLLQAREKMMLTITHDIKAPAGAVIGYIDLLARLIIDQRQRFYLDNMRNSTIHLLNLVKSLLDFYRLDSNRMEVNCVPLNPVLLFREIYIGFEPQAARKGLTLLCEIDELTLNAFYLGDPLHIRQIADNLLSNALKFTHEGRVSIQVSRQGGQLIFSVTDTGCGISEEEQKRIFQEFTRLANAQGEEGFGLGLSITQKLVVLLNGELQIDSKTGQGTTFRVSLPLPVADVAIDTSSDLNTSEQEAVKDRSSEKAIMETNSLNKKILLIDDDPLQIEMLSALLDKEHFNVTGCNQPEELFAFLEHETFAALLTDIQMPALNGFELLKEIHSRFPDKSKNLPVIALTARSDINMNILNKHGFSGCIHKPFTGQELMNTLRQVLSLQSEANRLQTMPEYSSHISDNSKEPDLSTLTAFSEGDNQASERIIRTFLIETEQNNKDFSIALEQRNLQVLTNIAHRLLPLFTMIGAETLLPSLKWIESQRDVPITDISWERMDKEAHFLIEEIKTMIHSIRLKYRL